MDLLRAPLFCTRVSGFGGCISPRSGPGVARRSLADFLGGRFGLDSRVDLVSAPHLLVDVRGGLRCSRLLLLSHRLQPISLGCPTVSLSLRLLRASSGLACFCLLLLDYRRTLRRLLAQPLRLCTLRSLAAPAHHVQAD